MTMLVRPLATVATLLVVLTYLLLHGSAPDPRERERQLNLIDLTIIAQAALQRDVLQIRAGLLSNYDPLVDGIDRLRSNAGQLETILPPWPGVPERLADLRRAIEDQEPLINTINSSNALVRNSIAYFTYLVQDEVMMAGGLKDDVANLVVEMLRFAGGVDHRGSGELARRLARLAATPAREPGGLDQSIIIHSSLILTHASILDRSLAGMSRSQVAEAATALRSLLVEEYGQLNRRATVYHVLLYIAAILLLAYLSYLYLRLRHNLAVLGGYSSTLESRAAYQSLVAELSTSFIDVPPERIDQGIEEGLARLGRHFEVDRAYLVIAADGNRSADRALVWSMGDHHGTPDWPLAALRLLEPPAMAEFERDGCIVVPSVQDLPSDDARAVLEEQGVGAWLGVPLEQLGRRVALLALEVARTPRAWHVDSFTHLRMAGEIFAHALERQRAEAERTALTGRLVQAERMQAIGTLAGGIAHNFNNILGAILGYAEMAFEGSQPGSRLRRHIDEVRKAGTRAKFLVDQILMFGRRAEHRRAPVRLDVLLDETLGLLGAILPATVTVETAVLDADATVLGDPAQLQQIVMNLCTNAAQAMNGVGRVELTVSTVEHRGECVFSHGSAPGGRYVRLAVADHGSGMDEATLERIFEPFFTTKAAGSGLGLATVHGIVTEHGGVLNVTSQPGQSTVFEVYLPATDAAAPLPAATTDLSHPGAGQTILIVDDDEALVLMGEEVLAMLGYEPVGFTSPIRALEVFEADPTRFDLVLSDEVMPEMTGDRLAARIAAIRPGLPILLVTGYGGLIATDRLPASAIREVLHKPLVPADLAAALGRHLAPLP
jgi:signal transduction histidine kinase/CheY-like chemotaxis protein